MMVFSWMAPRIFDIAASVVLGRSKMTPAARLNTISTTTTTRGGDISPPQAHVVKSCYQETKEGESSGGEAATLAGIRAGSGWLEQNSNSSHLKEVPL